MIGFIMFFKNLRIWVLMVASKMSYSRRSIPSSFLPFKKQSFTKTGVTACKAKHANQSLSHPLRTFC